MSGMRRTKDELGDDVGKKSCVVLAWKRGMRETTAVS